MRLWILIAVLLAGCTTEPKIVSSADRSVSISYNPNFMAREEVAGKAQAYCRNLGFNAIYVSDDVGFGGRVINWTCVP